MRTYLVVIDQSEESTLAMRFAARRAAKTGGNVHILAAIEPQDFVAFGAVAATMAEEARMQGEELASSAAAAVSAEFGISPRVTVREGKIASVVRDVLAEDSEIAAFVLGAARDGEPGPLVAHFTGAAAGALPCPVMIIPGSLSTEALDRLS